jgi:hypothetical protein
LFLSVVFAPTAFYQQQLGRNFQTEAWHLSFMVTPLIYRFALSRIRHTRWPCVRARSPRLRLLLLWSAAWIGMGAGLAGFKDAG